MNVGEQFGTLVPHGGKQPSQAANRMKQIEHRLGKGAIDGTLTEEELDRLHDEYRQLQTRTKAMKYSSMRIARNSIRRMVCLPVSMNSIRTRN